MAFNLYLRFVVEKHKLVSGQWGINSICYLKVDSLVAQNSYVALWNVENGK